MVGVPLISVTTDEVKVVKLAPDKELFADSVVKGVADVKFVDEGAEDVSVDRDVVVEVGVEDLLVADELVVDDEGFVDVVSFDVEASVLDLVLDSEVEVGVAVDVVEVGVDVGVRVEVVLSGAGVLVFR